MNIIIISEDDPQGLLWQKDAPHQHPGQTNYISTQEVYYPDIQILTQPIYSFLSWWGRRRNYAPRPARLSNFIDFQLQNDEGQHQGSQWRVHGTHWKDWDWGADKRNQIKGWGNAALRTKGTSKSG